MERQEIIYQLDGVDPSEGLDVHRLVPYLTSFDDLVHEAVREAGYEGELRVRVRPFREGSFITEFLIEGGAVDLLSGKEATAIANALGILGFCGVSAASLPRIVRAVRGHVERFRQSGDGAYEYGSGQETVIVDETAHRIIQSPKVASLYREVAVGPIGDFGGGVREVRAYTRDRGAADDGASHGSVFTRSDRESFAQYEKSAEISDESACEETTTAAHGIWLRPVSGSYGGARRGYTFCFGQGDETQVYKGVAIDDECFREKLESGSIRFTAGDFLRVDLEITQRVTRSGKISASYRIPEVIEYKPLREPRQQTFGDFLR